MAELEARAHELAGQPFNLGSPKQVGEILFGKLGLPVVATYHTLFEEYLQHYAPIVPASWLRGQARGFSRRQCNALDAVVGFQIRQLRSTAFPRQFSSPPAGDRASRGVQPSPHPTIPPRSPGLQRPNGAKHRND